MSESKKFALIHAEATRYASGWGSDDDIKAFIEGARWAENIADTYITKLNEQIKVMDEYLKFHTTDDKLVEKKYEKFCELRNKYVNYFKKSK